MIRTNIKHQDTKLIDGPAGKLELAIGEPKGIERDAWGIVCHPHPLFGGTMDNKVVTVLAKTFQDLGVKTIRFNFRSVGRSEGSYDQGNGELEDLLAVIDWMQHEKVRAEIWLGGFSFGACIAAKAATQIPVNKLVTIAPPVEHFPMRQLPPITCFWVLAQGDQDEVVPANLVYEWAESRDPKPIILRFPQASHFFHGQLIELRTQLEEVLKT